MKYLITLLFGLLLSITAFSQDTTIYYDSGNIKESYEVVGIDKEWIEFKEYYKNGQLKSTGTFNLYGQKCGVWYSWWEDGTISTKARFQQNKKVGDWYIYDPDGKLTMWVHFKNNKVKKSIKYCEDDGLLITGL